MSKIFCPECIYFNECLGKETTNNPCDTGINTEEFYEQCTAVQPKAGGNINE